MTVATIRRKIVYLVGFVVSVCILSVGGQTATPTPFTDAKTLRNTAEVSVNTAFTNSALLLEPTGSETSPPPLHTIDVEPSIQTNVHQELNTVAMDKTPGFTDVISLDDAPITVIQTSTVYVSPSNTSVVDNFSWHNTPATDVKTGSATSPPLLHTIDVEPSILTNVHQELNTVAMDKTPGFTDVISLDDAPITVIQTSTVYVSPSNTSAIDNSYWHNAPLLATPSPETVVTVIDIMETIVTTLTDMLTMSASNHHSDISSSSSPGVTGSFHHVSSSQQVYNSLQNLNTTQHSHLVSTDYTITSPATFTSVQFELVSTIGFQPSDIYMLSATNVEFASVLFTVNPSILLLTPSQIISPTSYSLQTFSIFSSDENNLQTALDVSLSSAVGHNNTQTSSVLDTATITTSSSEVFSSGLLVPMPSQTVLAFSAYFPDDLLLSSSLPSLVNELHTRSQIQPTSLPTTMQAETIELIPATLMTPSLVDTPAITDAPIFTSMSNALGDNSLVAGFSDISPESSNGQLLATMLISNASNIIQSEISQIEPSIHLSAISQSHKSYPTSQVSLETTGSVLQPTPSVSVYTLDLSTSGLLPTDTDITTVPYSASLNTETTTVPYSSMNTVETTLVPSYSSPNSSTNSLNPSTSSLETPLETTVETLSSQQLTSSSERVTNTLVTSVPVSTRFTRELTSLVAETISSVTSEPKTTDIFATSLPLGRSSTEPTISPSPSPSNGLLSGATTQKPTTTPGIVYWTLDKGLTTQECWLKTVIAVPPSQDIDDIQFIIDLELGFARAYDLGKQRQSQKAQETERLLDQLDPYINPLVLDRKKRASTHNGYTVQMIDQMRNSLYPQNVETVFYVAEGNNYNRVLAYDSVATYSMLTLSELTFFIGYPVKSEITEYIPATVTPIPPVTEDDQLWIIAAVLVPLFILFLCAFFCCCFCVKKRDTDIDPDTLKIIQYKQKYPYRHYPSGNNTPRGFDVAKDMNGIENKGLVINAGELPQKVTNENEVENRQPTIKRIDDEYTMSDTDSAVTNDSKKMTTNQVQRPLPPRGNAGQAGLFQHVAQLSMATDEKDRRARSLVIPTSLTPMESEESTKLNESLRQKAELERYRNKLRQREKKKTRRKKGSRSAVGDTKDEENAPVKSQKEIDEVLDMELSSGEVPPSFIEPHKRKKNKQGRKKGEHQISDAALPIDTEIDNHFGPHGGKYTALDITSLPETHLSRAPLPNSVYDDQDKMDRDDRYRHQGQTKVVIVPVTELPDKSSGGLIWNTYNAQDEVNAILSPKEAKAPGQLPPLTLESPLTGTILTLPGSNTTQDNLLRTPANKVHPPMSSSKTRPLTLSQLIASPGVHSNDTPLDTTGELSSPQMTDSLEMDTQWAQPALMESLSNGGVKSVPVKLSWTSEEGVTPRVEIPETKTPREQVELDMLSSSKLERTAGKPRNDDYDEMDVAYSVKVGENPQPLIRAIRDELVRLQRKGSTISEL